MKIVQLMARIEGSGVTRYVIELNKGLKANGHDVEVIYVKAHEKAEMDGGTQSIPFAVEYDYSDATVKHINEADLVIINSIMEKKADEKYHNLWMDLVMNKITTRKAIVCNDHNVLGFAAYYGPLLHNSEFWLAFDKIITFAPRAMVAQKICAACGEAEFRKRFVQLILPHNYSEEDKKAWVPANEKLRRVTYLGRHSGFKDPTRLLRGRDKFYAHDYELEMRGIKRTINVSTIPDLLYSFDEQGNRQPSKACIMASDKKWREDNGIALDDPMLETPARQKGWCYVFDAYKREEGMKCVAKSAFGCDFFHLKTDGCYGDDFEYSVFEIIQMGSIPLLDWNAGNACRMYDEHTKCLNKTALEMGLGVFIKKDLSNLDEALAQMDELASNPDKYDELRNKIFEAFKKNCDAKSIAQKMVDDCFLDGENPCYNELCALDSTPMEDWSVEPKTKAKPKPESEELF